MKTYSPVIVATTLAATVSTNPLLKAPPKIGDPTCNTDNKPFNRSAGIEACQGIGNSNGRLVIDAFTEQVFLNTPPSDPRVVVLLNRFCHEDARCKPYDQPAQHAIDVCLTMTQCGRYLEVLKGAKIDTGSDFGAGTGFGWMSLAITGASREGQAIEKRVNGGSGGWGSGDKKDIVERNNGGGGGWGGGDKKDIVERGNGGSGGWGGGDKKDIVERGNGGGSGWGSGDKKDIVERGNGGSGGWGSGD